MTRIAGLLFFLSGAAALVYQVAWQRLLALHSGVGLYSVAMIVAAFMAGLGIGSHQGGRLSDAVSGQRALRAFAAIEFAIAAFGAVSCWLYYDWLYPRAVHLASPSWSGGLLHLMALLPPTMLMGMSLPFLVRAVVDDVEAASRRIGWLYGANVLGAAMGALAAPWLLFPSFGVRGAVLAAAATNLCVGLGSLALGAARSGERKATAPPPPRDPRRATGAEAPGGRPFRLWLLLYALSGFVALSLEIVWFRLLDVAVKSTAYTFGTVLAVYLFGSGLGALAGARFAALARRPLRAFLLAQCALLALAALPLIVAVALPPDAGPFAHFFNYWGAYGYFRLGHEAQWMGIFGLYLFLPLVLFFVPTLLMGFSFPILQQAVHDDPEKSGGRVGFLQAANVAGCTAGSLLVSLIALEHLGTTGTLRLMLAIGVVFAFVGWRHYGRGFVPVAVILVTLAWSLPGPERLWRRLHGLRPQAGVAFFEEDGTSLVALTPDDQSWRLSINGKGNSWVPYGGVHMLLGALPATIHPAPTDVAIIGLGSGDTAWASAWRGETRSLTVFEISAPQPRILRRLIGFQDFRDTRHLLEDPRLRIRIADGRKSLEAEATLYDLIEIDAVSPDAGGSGNLYSLEFFEAARRRLKPGGVMCTWSPTDRVGVTFRTVFENVLENEERYLLIGSRDPIPFAPVDWAARAARAAEYLGAERALELAGTIATLRPAGPALPVAPNRDLWPRDEYGR